MDSKVISPEEKRKNYFIKKSFQVRCMIKICTLVIIAQIVFGTILYLYLYSKRPTTVFFENSRLMLKNTEDFILPVLIPLGIVVSILMCGVSIIFVLVMSHKISSAIARLEKSTEAVGAGNLDLVVHFRAEDQMEPLAEEFNNMTGKLKNQMSQIKRLSEDLESDLEKLKKIQESCPKEERVRLIEQVVKKQKGLTKSVNYFKI